MLRKPVFASVFQESEAPETNLVDMPLFGAVLALLAVGLIMVSSASMEVSNSTFGNPFQLLIKQIIFLAVGLLSLLAMLLTPVNVIQRCHWYSLLIAFGALILVLFVGREINGSTRWISLYIFNLQASELAKICIIVYLASFLTRHLEEVQTQWSGFIKPLAILSAAAFLLLAEPDWGSAAVLMASAMGMIYMARAKLEPFVGMVALVSVGMALLVWAKPYRLVRVNTFIDPWADAFGAGYQLTQALIAFGRGGLFGEGLGNSIQKLFYLPEAHTDFIYAILAEELGLIGALVIISGFVFISWRSIQIAKRAEMKGMKFHAFLAYGLAFLFACQCLINLGVSSGFLPTKGLALPLISYGGSSLIMNCLSFGILLRIDYERRLAKVVEEPVIAGRKRKQKNKGGADE